MSTAADPSWTLVYELTRDQVVDSNVVLSMEMLTGRRRLVCGFIALLGVVAEIAAARSGVAAPGVKGAACFVLAAILWWWYPRSIRRFVERTLRDNGERGLVGRHELRVDAGGIREKTDVNERHDAWAGVTRVVNHEPYVMLVLSGGLFYPIPRSAFADEADVQAFVAAAKRWREAR
jgi:hypothetical protein